MARLTWIAVGVIAAALGVAAWRTHGQTPPPEAHALPAFETPNGAIPYADRENYFKSPYMAYAGDWSVKSNGLPLRPGVDYRDVIYVRPDVFPNDVAIRWHWPMKAPTAGVYGFMHLAYGYYAGGFTPAEVEPRRVSDVQRLTTEFAVDTLAYRGDFNLLSETFLTSRPRDFASKVAEVGFLTRISEDGRRFFRRGRQLGAWVDPYGQSWDVAVQAAYIMFTPTEGELKSGVLDFAAAFRWLEAKGELSGREWFNGVAIGVEPSMGEGTVHVQRWKVTYP